MDSIKYGKIVDFVHMLITYSYDGQSGLKLVDATCGNGFDALFLCRIAGASGHVFAFDIQEQAVERSRTLLEANLGYVNYDIIKDSHENVTKYMTDKIDVALFNLGYLPYSDKEVTTKPETTVSAIKSLIPMLNDDGRIFVTTYVGHDMGREIREISEYLQQLDNKDFNVVNVRVINKENSPPEIFIIEKNA